MCISVCMCVCLCVLCVYMCASGMCMHACVCVCVCVCVLCGVCVCACMCACVYVFVYVCVCECFTEGRLSGGLFGDQQFSHLQIPLHRWTPLHFLGHDKYLAIKDTQNNDFYADSRGNKSFKLNFISQCLVVAQEHFMNKKSQ